MQLIGPFFYFPAGIRERCTPQPKKALHSFMQGLFLLDVWSMSRMRDYVVSRRPQYR